MTVTVKVRATKFLEGVFQKYQPTIGKVYDAEYNPGIRRNARNTTSGPACAPFCVVKISDMPIVLRKGEFEVVGGNDNGKP